jgi:hypothetical protein
VYKLNIQSNNDTPKSKTKESSSSTSFEYIYISNPKIILEMSYQRIQINSPTKSHQKPGPTDKPAGTVNRGIHPIYFYVSSRHAVYEHLVQENHVGHLIILIGYGIFIYNSIGL